MIEANRKIEQLIKEGGPSTDNQENSSNVRVATAGSGSNYQMVQQHAEQAQL